MVQGHLQRTTYHLCRSHFEEFGSEGSEDKDFANRFRCEETLSAAKGQPAVDGTGGIVVETSWKLLFKLIDNEFAPGHLGERSVR